MKYELIDNPAKSRFEIHLNDHVAFIEYERKDKVIAYTHTEVPKALGGKGIGSYLAKSALEYAASNNLNVIPYCPFIKVFIDKHPSYQANSLLHPKDA
ncbi:N-acetyltransferase [Flavobacteriaceae bacterium F08102]|nr:N-acetyltransferase [Flavobacteriaceae bacterium F08102]